MEINFNNSDLDSDTVKSIIRKYSRKNFILLKDEHLTAEEFQELSNEIDFNITELSFTSSSIYSDRMDLDLCTKIFECICTIYDSIETFINLDKILYFNISESRRYEKVKTSILPYIEQIGKLICMFPITDLANIPFMDTKILLEIQKKFNELNHGDIRSIISLWESDEI